MCGVRLNTEENYICQRVMGHQRRRKDRDSVYWIGLRNPKRLPDVYGDIYIEVFSPAEKRR